MISSSLRRSSRFSARKPAHRSLRLDTLEQRALLAVVANDDGPYTIAEDDTLSVGATPETLIARGETWSYLDQITNGLAPATGEPTTPLETYPLDAQGDAWFEVDFDTATSDPAIGTWESGTAPLGAGSLGEPIATQWDGNERVNDVSGVRNTVTTYLMQKKFTVSAAALATNPGFVMDLLADDGVVVYINGTEVARHRINAGAVATDQFANAAGPENYATAAFSLTDAQIAALLVAAPAENVISVELHQNSATSTDSGFDLSLSAVPPGGLLANDTVDPGTQPTTITVATQPAHGTVNVSNNGSFTYTPADDYNGPDSFVYSVTNGVDTDTATVSINVTSVADPPDADDDAYTIAEDTTLVATSPTATSPTVLLPQGSTWDYLDEITNGANGTPAESYPLDAQGDAWNEADFDIATSDASIGTWESGNGLFALDSITCCTTATTLGGTAAENTTYLFRRTLTISPSDAAAIASRGLRVRYVVDDGAVLYLNGLEVQRVNMPAAPAVIDTNTLATAGGAEGTAGAGLPSVFDLPPVALPAGTYVIAVEVHQVAADSTDIGFDVQVEIPPVIQGILANDSDADGDPITSIDIVPGRAPRHGSVVINNDGTFTYTPNANYFGADQFEYTITAGGETSTPAVVVIDVTAVQNDDPTPANDVYTVGNTQTLEASLVNYDANRTTAGVNTLLPAGSNWFYIDDGSNQDALNPNWKQAGFDPAAAGWSGPSPAELGFGDDDEATEIADGEITYYFANSFNLASTAGIDSILVHLRRDDGAAVYLNGNQVVLDNLPAVHPFNQLAGFQTGSETQYFTYRVPITPGMLNVGANYVAVEVHQQTTTSSDVSFDLAITTPFDSPTNQFGVRANDTDPDNRGTVTLAVVTPPAQHEGTFTLNNDGTFTYNPVDTFSGVDTFTYSYTTGSGTATATVTINVESSTCGFNADLNGSGNVNRADVAIFAMNFGARSGATPSQGDIDCDGDVDLHDLIRLQSSYTGGSPSPEAPGAPAAAVATAPIASPRGGATAAVDRALRVSQRTLQVPRSAPKTALVDAPATTKTVRASRSVRPAAGAVDSVFGSGE